MTDTKKETGKKTSSETKERRFGIKESKRKPFNGPKPKRPKKKPKPSFRVLNLGFIARVKDRWRRPRGTHNKQRLKFAWTGATPRIGYKNPIGVRGMREDGRREILVRGTPDIEKIKALTEHERAHIAVRFASSLSKRKRAEIASVVAQLGIKLINFKG
ncbi:MAG: eL32 family ribosomal protein [Candidatus Bilamarchaeaceae archaeon]